MAKTNMFNLYSGISNTKVLRWFNKVNNLDLLSNLSFSRKKGQFLQQNVISIPLHPDKKTINAAPYVFQVLLNQNIKGKWQHDKFK